MRSAAYARLRRLLKIQRRFLGTLESPRARETLLDKNCGIAGGSGKALYIPADSFIKNGSRPVYRAV